MLCGERKAPVTFGLKNKKALSGAMHNILMCLPMIPPEGWWWDYPCKLDNFENFMSDFLTWVVILSWKSLGKIPWVGWQISVQECFCCLIARVFPPPHFWEKTLIGTLYVDVEDQIILVGYAATKIKVNDLGPVVQSIISLMSSLVVWMIIVLVSTISLFTGIFAEKRWVAFANAKATYFCFSKNISVYA